MIALKGETSRWVLPLIAAFVARALIFPLAHLDHPQFWEYGWIARNMLNLHTYAIDWSNNFVHGAAYPTAFMPPGQAVLIYWPMAVFGDNVSAYVVIFLQSVLMGVAFTYVMGKVVELIFHRERITQLGLWFAALYPSFVIAVTSFGVLSAVLLLDAVFLYCALRLFEQLRERKPASAFALATGVTAGLLSFFRSESLAVSALSILLLCVLNRKIASGYGKSAALVFASLLIVVLPWTLRNYSVFHKVIMGSTNGGFNFWRGHNPTASGSSWHMDGSPVWSSDTLSRTIAPNGIADPSYELKYNAYHLELAKEWIAAHPALEAERSLKKAVLFWGIDWYSKDARSAPYILIYAATMIFFVTGLIRARKDKPWRLPTAKDAFTLIALWSALYTIITMVFFDLPRLQILLVGVYFPIVVYGAERWVVFLRTPRSQVLKARAEANNEPVLQ